MAFRVPASPPCGWNALTEACGCWLGLADAAGPFAGLSKKCHIVSSCDPFCVLFLEELRQRGLDEWLASLSFDNPDCPDLQLTMGAVIVEEIRAAVEAATGFRCSAGISHNKVRA